MIEHPEVEIVTVGAGWTGGILAQRLTAAGHEVLSLEKGRAQWTWPDFAHNHDELRYSVRHELMHEIATETWTWRPDPRAPSLPMRQYGSFHPGSNLGGAGVHWAGVTWRFQPEDFTWRSHYVDRYGESRLPEGVSAQDWPLTYDDLEPYYDTFEYDVGVSGQTGNLAGQLIQGGNPFEGPRARPYPLPPLAPSRGGLRFAEACEALGYHPFITPSGILSEGYVDLSGAPRAGCLYCGFCTRYGCHVDAKSSALTAHVPMALETGRYEIRTRCWVLDITTDNSGRATGVRYMGADGREHHQPAGTVFLCGYTLSNVRLLLLSTGAAHPDGIGNDRGHVGRNYSYQLERTVATGVFEGERFNTFMGSGSTGHRMYDLTGPALDHTALDFVGGAMFFDGSGERTPIGAVEGIPASEEPTDEEEAPEWGAAFKDRMRDWDSWLQIGISGESIAYEPHRLDLDPNYTDAFGRPLLRLTFDWTPNEYAMYRYMAERGAEIMREMGPDRARFEPELEPYNIDEYGSTHNQGGAIMGASPGDSVTNRYGQVWDTPNVFVAGAALFPQNPPANPTGTVCALAYHTADAYTASYRDGELMS